MSIQITGTTRLGGLLGSPVSHSISPLMHNESFRMLGLDLVCVFESEEQVRNMVPDQAKLMEIEGRLQNATAADMASAADCVSRSFAPKVGVAEDPVCGSAHCQIADYWAGVLGKSEIHAYQASKRGGHLYCELLGNGRISISGEAVLVAISEIVAEL